MTWRAMSTLATVLAVALLLALLASIVDHAAHHSGLPLTNANVIREQASEKHLDPALVAAVIYAETKFEPRPSSAGAQGLMQILPETAYFIEHLSGGTTFTTSDLATPQINVAYGTYYLRYLLDHYGGALTLALAAYNAGLTNVDQWVARARAQGTELNDEAIPFPETREYVRRVLSAQREYRATYGHELGIS